MGSQKSEQSTTQSTKETSPQLFVVVVTNSTLTQVVCGGFTTRRRAEKFAKKLNALNGAFEAVATPVMPVKLVYEYLKAGLQ